MENRPDPDRRAPDGDDTPHSDGSQGAPAAWETGPPPPAWAQKQSPPLSFAPQPPTPPAPGPVPTAPYAHSTYPAPGAYGDTYTPGAPVGPPTTTWPPGPVGPPSAQNRHHGGTAVLFGAFTAAIVALVALAASVLVVASTPQEESSPRGTNLSLYYDDSLTARPDPVEVDLATHPLYEVAMPTQISCDLPDLDSRSEDAWLDFATVSGACLDDLWAPVLEELGLHPEPLEYTVTTESPDDFEDEEGYTLAYYEGDHTRITVVLPSVRELDQHIPEQHRQSVWLALMGHEYGHHVQHATGILGVSHDLRNNAGDEDEELDTLRRTELQAECLAGTALHGIGDGATTTLDTVNEYFNDEGDLNTHGRAVNRAHWLEQGWHQETMDGCNTYRAGQRRVT